MLAIRDSKVRKVLLQGLIVTQASPISPPAKKASGGTGRVVITIGVPDARTYTSLLLPNQRAHGQQEERLAEHKKPLQRKKPSQSLEIYGQANRLAT